MPFDLFTFTYSSIDSDILNPATIGHAYHTVPAGSFCDCSVLIRDVADQPGDLILSAGFSNTSGMGAIGAWDYNAAFTNPSVVDLEALAQAIAGVPTPQSTPRTFWAKFDTVVCLRFAPSGIDPTFFQGQLVLKQYS